MANYLVSAVPRKERIDDLREQLATEAFLRLRPFGQALSYSLDNARRRADGTAIWEEEDYCTPPLKQERETVLDHYFSEIRTERVGRGEGWRKIEELPLLFPALHANPQDAAHR